MNRFTFLGHAILLIPAAAFPLGGTPTDTRSPADINHPPIGTEGYSAGCIIEAAWEDGSAIAQCADGVRYVYDPDGQWVPGIADNPARVSVGTYGTKPRAAPPGLFPEDWSQIRLETRGARALRVPDSIRRRRTP